jgi:chromosome segregation protein
MLTRLELIGFKSFADKTRFDFAPGVTAVVGPNGSGKSNVVDAVKWVLGEQSAKALRGGEMADVIFNGSSTRKSLGVAEVTMTFDNRRRQLDTDADEVQITRRVYRDGQGEYLINGQSSRLKDIRDLFLGSGAGHGAYSVIEQGRVDGLLTASNTDRRVVFEEAAGISRFKARKVETLRKLERVDADLTRVRDILTELDKQLRSLRFQAAKAQRYQEYTGRLKELRVGLGLREFRDLSDTLTREERVLDGLRAETSGVAERERIGEDRLRELDAAAGAVDRELREHEAALGEAKQAIAGHEAGARSDRGQSERWEADLLRLGKQRIDLETRQRRLDAERRQAAAELAEVEQLAADERERADAAVSALTAVSARIAVLTKSSQADRDAQFDLARTTTRLQSETETLRREAERQRRELNGRLVELDRTTRKHDALVSVLEDLTRTDADVQQKLAGARQNLAEHVTYRDDLRRRADALQADLDSLREARSALRGRADVLEGLEQSLEGLGAGVREVMARLAAGQPELAPVAGLVADVLSAPREVAPLIDLALGDAAQRFVVTDPAKLDAVVAALTELPGRVGLVPLSSGTGNAVTGWGGVAHPVTAFPVPTASALISVSHPALAALPGQLLGDVLLVPDLPAARELARTHPDARFVTRAGELLEPDGTLTVGPVVAGTGILSRKSELRELKDQIAAHDARIAELETQQAAYRRQSDAMDAPVRALETEIAALGGEAGTLQTRIRDQRLEQERLADSLHLTRTEIQLAEADLRNVEGEADTRHEEWQNAAEQERALKARLAEAESALAAAEKDRDARQAENTTAQVALSRVTAQLAGLRKKREELDSELNLRRIDAVNLGSAERSARSRSVESQLLVLRATAAAAEAYAAKEIAERAVNVLSADLHRLTTERDQLRSEVKAFRDTWAKHRDRAHAHEMLVQDLTLRRDAVTNRLREDYGVELAELAQGSVVRGQGTGEVLLSTSTLEGEVGSGSAATEPGGGWNEAPPPAPATAGLPSPSRGEGENLDPDAAEEEIADLRRKIAKLGSVNLDALDELADVEKREGDLRRQHDDLTDAQNKLVEIITKINADSRRLFVETLATVRVHFQELFRKLFGGGTADVVLEDESDPLESGIDITARPPGKDLRSISLLSGGERTLTAVALLLAIFRSRPSPFCLLDEVDAALDEANTARLAGVLREFLDRSQFIVVTHKKRTMAIADVLYGVTMQESGVSKQVAVRFEDWPEDEPQAANPAA